MGKTIKINGMSCAHCEMRVKKQLEGITGVQSAEVSAKEGQAVVKLTKDVASSEFKNAVEEAGYEYVKIVE